jgi:hypothetical protein
MNKVRGLITDNTVAGFPLPRPKRPTPSRKSSWSTSLVGGEGLTALLGGIGCTASDRCLVVIVAHRRW